MGEKLLPEGPLGSALPHKKRELVPPFTQKYWGTHSCVPVEVTHPCLAPQFTGLDTGIRTNSFLKDKIQLFPQALGEPGKGTAPAWR